MLSNAERRARYYRRWKDKHLQWALDNPEKAERSKRSHHLRNTFGITIEQYEVRLAEQGGVCAVCRQPETKSGHKHLSVDHCHDSGKIRGLLCHACNCVVGYAKNNPATMRAAAEYIERTAQ